jgi:hypothetical protein
MRCPPLCHRLAQDAAENLDRFEIGQLASCDFQFFSLEFPGALEGQSDESADVVRCNGLVGLISANRVCEFAFQDSEFHLVDVIRLHERGGANYGGGQVQASDMFLHFPFAFAMRNSRLPLGATEL